MKQNADDGNRTKRARRIRSKLRKHARLRDIVTELSTEFINFGGDDIDARIHDALRRVGEFAGVDRSYVFVISDDRTRMSNTHEWCCAGVAPEIANMQDVPLESFGLCMSRILQREVLQIRRVSELPDDVPDKAQLAEQGIQSLLSVPIVSKDVVIGFFGFDAVRSERRWTSDAVSLLKIVASIFGNAIERMRSDRSLRREKEFAASVIESAGSLLAVLTADGVCKRLNARFTELTGVNVERMNEIGWAALVPAEHHAAARTAMSNALSGDVVQFECPLRAANGDVRTIFWNTTPIRSDSGIADHAVLAGTDLTEVRLLREELAQSRRIEGLGRVAATIAHEFNNVLMSISPWAEIIVKRPDRVEDVSRAAERISRAVKRGGGITAAVTRFARPAEPVLRDLRADEWTCALVDDMRELVNERSRRRVQIEGICSSEASVLADPAQLHQVFSNLVLNAVDAIADHENGSGRVAISVEKVASHERLTALESDSVRWVHWQVCDSGTGIAPAALERIFEPLFTTKKKGTGLGLAVAHQIIQAHRGTIAVDTAAGRGTTFHVFLRSVEPA
ncbi:MAG TPA: ATP-binding protein [Thermoanaerobaculia bacterium]|nr:ATP-binding protein [Thermoanaerobaculia bacterium]